METTHPAPVISAVVLPRSTAVSAALVVGFALLTAAAAQVSIPLWFTPVPITGQTFAVLLSGAALGANLGAGSQLLYVGLGAIGLPFYASGNSGMEVVTGATGGYLIGFVLAAWLTGYLAERRGDRRVATALPMFLAGNLVIYLIGVPWLHASVDSIATIPDAIDKGLRPFIGVDLIKIALAGLILPTAWRNIDRLRLS